MIRITLLTLALSLAPAFCWATEPQAKASDNDAAQLKALQDERIRTLTQTVAALTAQYKVGMLADVSQVFSAENELCNAQLEVTDEPEKRIALLTEQLRTANELLKVAQARVDAGTVTEVDIFRAKSVHLGLKIKLLRERGRKSPPSKTAQDGDATGAKEEYKIVGGMYDKKLESNLNDLAKQGWRVRASAYSGQYIILAR